MALIWTLNTISRNCGLYFIIQLWEALHKVVQLYLSCSSCSLCILLGCEGETYIRDQLQQADVKFALQQAGPYTGMQTTGECAGY
jgi:hypothetical protein